MLAIRDARGRRRGSRPTDRIEEPSAHDRFTARGARARGRLRHAIREGNALRVRIGDRDGHALIEIPLRLGLPGGRRMKPVWDAVDALAAGSEELTFDINREPAWPRPSHADPAAREGSGEE